MRVKAGMEDLAAIHVPVMLEEVLAGLSPRTDGRYLDGTLGIGGHAQAVLEAAPGSRLCGLDQDEEALELARRRLEHFGGRVHSFHLPFSEFETALSDLHWESIEGALLDLGVSSLQLDLPRRGFSFRESGPLDMRMDVNGGKKSAWHLVNRAPYAELRDCFATLGEDPQAGRIARHIVDARQKASIDDTATLAEIIWRAYPPAWRRSARRHPATRAFQALRMVVNDELGELERFLARIPDWLSSGGRLVIISFHSLEDRLVKRAMKRWVSEREDMRIITRKPLVPDEQEVARNPRASSAKLRIAEKI